MFQFFFFSVLLSPFFNTILHTKKKNGNIIFCVEIWTVTIYYLVNLYVIYYIAINKTQYYILYNIILYAFREILGFGYYYSISVVGSFTL